MKEVAELSREELIRIVVQIQDELFLDEDEEGNEVWDPDREVSGADFIDAVSLVLQRFDLIPEQVRPAFRGVREVGVAEELARLLHRMRAGGKERLLDELVLEVKTKEVRDLSEANALARVDFLISRLGAEEAARKIREILGDEARAGSARPDQ